MKQKRFRLGALVAILLLGVVLLAYAANVGSEQDPLISMSYLQESYTEELMEQVDQKLEAQSEELRKQVDAAVQEVQGQQGTQTELETFEVVTLSKGQTLYGDIGCEVIAAAITVGLYRLPVSFCTISTGRIPPCSLPTTGLRSA